MNAPSTEYRRCALRFLGDISVLPNAAGLSTSRLSSSSSSSSTVGLSRQLVKVSSEWVDSVLYVRMELSAETGDPASPASDDDSASLAGDNKDSTVISILADPSLPFPFVTMPEIKRLFQAFIRRAYEMGESQVLVELLNEKQFRGVEFDSTSALGTAISSLPEPSPLRGVKKGLWGYYPRSRLAPSGACAHQASRHLRASLSAPLFCTVRKVPVGLTPTYLAVDRPSRRTTASTSISLRRRTARSASASLLSLPYRLAGLADTFIAVCNGVGPRRLRPQLDLRREMPRKAQAQRKTLTRREIRTAARQGSMSEACFNQLVAAVHV